MNSGHNVDLLNKAIETFNSASAKLIQYYSTLEDKVRLLTEEVDHKKQLLDSILDSIDVGVIFFDRDGVVRIMNKAAETLLGINVSNVIGGKSIYAEIHKDVIVPSNGRPFYALISQSGVTDRDGNLIGNVLIFKDITRLKQLESENERNRRLTAMGELVMKIAHEIRNPLGSIELFASLLSNDLKGTEHGDYANRISNSVRSLVNTLDNMLSFTREVRPKLEYCCLNEVVEETCDEFRELFSNSDIHVDFSEKGQHWLYIDKGLIRQALINILLNSVHAMPDGGKIEIKIEECELRDVEGEGREGELHNPHSAICITIKDTGIGMDEETRSRMFEPFFSTKDRGTGLGMSITAGIIKAHKGIIDVRSEYKKGTEFVITLPVKSMNK
ncbi:sensor histidine kinase [Dissulfurispira thermophila]|uniref:histidine kinase n=2 Tax=root TaxID=1 RepID=A0A7G1H2S4_9BACT|nr:ATP-binding protein [Dissulfurispira thermophila]BCB96479.1 sensor histidine kinase [Dissulfurispira thermophila]